MSKTMILPFIGVIAMVVKAVTGIDVDTNVQAQVADFVVIGVSTALTIYGIIKNHKNTPSV